ncbi:MAG: hypothetical protein K9M98_05160 [Cephaloticoccus sp.]|nr:hypothetical protein [Cephaloticoccus sp.]MCF7759871.1 hypothetical protein [Cephaloticoccus sp.]
MMHRRSYLLVGVIALSVHSLSAQPGMDPGQTKIPELFAGELEDVGPQYLLLPKASRQAWELWTDLEITGTSNATLVNENPKFSTITAVQAGVIWHAPVTPRWTGQFTWEVGARAQTYRYGYLTGMKKIINYVEVDRNNFDLVGVQVRGTWWRDHWLASAGLRTSTMHNRAANHTFYEELALEWQLFRTWSLNPNRTLAAGLEGAGRLTNTDSYGILPKGWNDRLEQGLFAVLDQGFGNGWYLQPALRVLASHYTQSDRSRTDWHLSGRVAVTHELSRNADVRLSVGYDQRKSTESDISDFKKWDLALALSASWHF